MRTVRRVVVASVLGTAAAMGCQGDPSTPSPDAGSDADADAGITLPPPTWSACSLLTDGTTSDAECSQAQVPLDWSQPGAQQITYFVKRYHPPNVTTKADLWMIAGGPGAGGDGFEAFAAALASAGHVDV